MVKWHCKENKGDIKNMRLWDFRLLDKLDDFHIVSQYRELLAIKRAIDKNGTPNHRLVNKVLDYSIGDFKAYTLLVQKELEKRGIKYIKKNIEEILNWKSNCFKNEKQNQSDLLYYGWHNHRYLTQCFYNLEEKYDCGIVSESAWKNISNYYIRKCALGE